MSIRVRGLLQCIGAGVIFAIALYWLMGQQTANPNFRLPGGPFGLILLMTPGGFSLAGLIQFISGVPFNELSDKWNALAGWQRGVYGILIFFVALAVAVGILALYLMTIYK